MVAYYMGLFGAWVLIKELYEQYSGYCYAQLKDFT